jgi:hypothetical protein
VSARSRSGYQGYINLKGYGEFDAHDRPHGRKGV